MGRRAGRAARPWVPPRAEQTVCRHATAVHSSAVMMARTSSRRMLSQRRHARAPAPAGATVAVLAEGGARGEAGWAGGGAPGAPWVRPLGRWELLADPGALEEAAACALLTAAATSRGLMAVQLDLALPGARPTRRTSRAAREHAGPGPTLPYTQRTSRAAREHAGPGPTRDARSPSASPELALPGARPRPAHRPRSARARGAGRGCGARAGSAGGRLVHGRLQRTCRR